MRLMALGEIGAFILGCTLATLALYAFSDAYPPLRITGTLAVWYLATKHALRFVHWGYKPNKRT
jgi:hypothetical protein